MSVYVCVFDPLNYPWQQLPSAYQIFTHPLVCKASYPWILVHDYNCNPFHEYRILQETSQVAQW